MSKGLLATKMGMTGRFTAEGNYLPVTVVLAGPCVVTQIKTKAKDGYDALQLGLGKKKANRVNKPLAGHMQKSGEGNLFRYLKEVAVDNPEAYQVGQTLAVTDVFSIGERVDVTGYTKGRGFSGVIKRHNFHGGRKTHGSKCYRIPGSIGCSAWPSKVVKGKKLPGHYGNAKKTVKNLEIVDIRPEDNVIMLKGALPGAANGLLKIRKTLKKTKKTAQ